MYLPTIMFGPVSLRHTANYIDRPAVWMGGRRSSALRSTAVVARDAECVPPMFDVFWVSEMQTTARLQELN